MRNLKKISLALLLLITTHNGYTAEESTIKETPRSTESKANPAMAMVYSQMILNRSYYAATHFGLLYKKIEFPTASTPDATSTHSFKTSTDFIATPDRSGSHKAKKGKNTDLNKKPKKSAFGSSLEMAQKITEAKNAQKETKSNNNEAKPTRKTSAFASAIATAEKRTKTKKSNDSDATPPVAAASPANPFAPLHERAQNLGNKNKKAVIEKSDPPVKDTPIIGEMLGDFLLMALEPHNRKTS